jgi:hypothetical protein
MPLQLKLTIFLFLIVSACRAQPNERIHLHFDKDIYLPGETIWFKAYMYNNNALSTVSTNFYTAIYDEAGKLLEQKMYPIADGTAKGSFSIPGNIESGKLQLVAFTKGMIFYDNSNVFKKILSIYKKDTPQNTIPAANNVSLQFFPEGGNWVAGISNTVAFKAWNEDGSPAQVSGKIMDEETHTAIDSFSTNTAGLGKLQLMPEEKIYTALWKDADGKIIKTELPAVTPLGITLHAELVKKELYYVINKNATAENLKTLHLLAQMENEELYKADILIGDKNYLVNKFSIDSLPSGIMQLTLFNSDWQPLQERIIFINASKNTLPLIKEEERSSAAKAKNIIELIMPDNSVSNLSASIADINFYDRATHRTIQQDLWVNAQLKGLNSTIANEIETGNSAAIDLVMLTHGWRKYSWQKVINKQVETVSPIDNFLSLNIHYKEKNYALPGDESLSLVINDKVTGRQYHALNPASQTSFYQSGFVFYDSARVSYKLNKNKEMSGNLLMKVNDSINIPAYITGVKNMPKQNSSSAGLIDTSFNNIATKFNTVQTFKTIVVNSKYVNPVTKRMQQLDDKYTSGLFSGLVRGYQINVVDDIETETSDIYSYIRYKMPTKLGVSGITGARQFYPCSMTMNDTCDPIPVFLNENEMPGDILESVPLSTIAYIKYTPGIVIGSSFTSANGALYVYTRKGSDDSQPSTSPMRSVTVKGYDLAKEFFNPDYSDKASLLQPDLRTTVYWNPYIITGKDNNKVKLEYYNNDISKKLLLTIEGVNEAGKLIHIEKIIE